VRVNTIYTRCSNNLKLAFYFVGWTDIISLETFSIENFPSLDTRNNTKERDTFENERSIDNMWPVRLDGDNVVCEY